MITKLKMYFTLYAAPAVILSALAMAMFLSWFVFAQAAFGQPVTAPPSDADMLTDLARTGVKAAADRKWGLLVSAVVYGLVWAARAWGGKFWPVLTSNRAGALLGLAASLIGGLVAAFKAGEPVDLNLVAAILGVWWTTAGGQTTIKDIFWGSWEPKKNGAAKPPT